MGLEMQNLRKAWLGVKESPFYALSKEEIINEKNISVIVRRLDPLCSWLTLIGEAFKSLDPAKAKDLQARVKRMNHGNNSSFFVPLEKKVEEVFMFGVLFASYGVYLGHENSCFKRAEQLCGRVNKLENCLQKEATDKEVKKSLMAISKAYLQFAEVLGDS